MNIEYKNKYGKSITMQQAESLEQYIKVYFDGGQIKRKETIYKGNLLGLVYYKDINESHQDILNTEMTAVGIIIREIEFFGDYRLEKDFFYNEVSIITRYFNALYDPNNFLIARESLDENGSVNYLETFKFYYDVNITENPEYYVFKCTYSQDGSQVKVNFPNDHLDIYRQESLFYSNALAHTQDIMNFSGISQTLMDYYMSPDVTPSGPLS